MNDRANLVSRVHQAEAVVEGARAELRSAQQALLDFDMKAAGIAVGDIVEKSGHRFRVSSVAPWSFDGGKPSLSLHGNPQKKDGSWGIANRYIGTNWKRVEDQAAA